MTLITITRTEPMRIVSSAPAARNARRILALAAVAVLAACGAPDGVTGPRPSAAVLPPPPHYPLIFVHGYNANSTTWTTMMNRFLADGWSNAELVDWSYNYTQSNATTAALIASKVDSVLTATGAHHVDLITHSMGALSARYYVRNILPSRDTRVDAVVILGGPDHGTNTAYGCASTSCIEMRPGSRFLKKLNSIDESWGTPTYATWWSPCDDVILPTSSVSLSGATNTETACLTHFQLHEDATVYAQVKTLVSQTRYGL